MISGDSMKYNKKVFIDNINYLVKYNCEPEVTIHLKNNEIIFLIVYKDYVDVTFQSNEIKKLSKIDDLFNYIKMDDIVQIEDCIDHLFPIQSQSIIDNGKLWIDAHSPQYIFKKYNQQLSIFRCTIAISMITLLIFLVFNISKINSFYLIIYFSLLFIFSILIALVFYLFDKRRFRIIMKYYGEVTEEDKIIAKQLLEEIDKINNEYDFYDLFHIDHEETIIKDILKQISIGRKIKTSQLNLITQINNEIKNNNIDNKYNNFKYNELINDFCILVERNSACI